MVKQETMIKIKKDTHKLLTDLKMIPREPFNDVLKRLIKYWKEGRDAKER